MQLMNVDHNMIAHIRLIGACSQCSMKHQLQTVFLIQDGTDQNVVVFSETKGNGIGLYLGRQDRRDNEKNADGDEAKEELGMLHFGEWIRSDVIPIYLNYLSFGRPFREIFLKRKAESKTFFDANIFYRNPFRETDIISFAYI